MGGGPPDPAVLPAIAEAVAPTLRLLDELIDPSGLALGTFTIADIAAAPVLYRTAHTRLDLRPYPNLERWRDTLVARPAFTAAGPVL